MRSVSRIVVVAVSSVLAVSLAACSDKASPAAKSENSGGSGGSMTARVDGGGGGAASTTFPTDALSTFMTSDKTVQIELRTSPDQPIHVGPDNRGELRITEAATGKAIDGVTITVKTWMPVMRHACSAVPVKVKSLGEGTYLLDPLVATMPGKCELQLTLSMPLPDGGLEKIDVTSPTFDIPQQT